MNTYGLRLRQLPKPEYHLMKSLVAQLNLQDSGELFAVALRFMATVADYQLNGAPAGRLWIQQAVESLRTLDEATRQAEYQDGPFAAR